MGIHKSILFTVGCVCRFRPLVEFVVAVAKHKTNVDIWVLLLN